MEDLWPDEIGRERTTSPVAILREQGSFLGARSGNLLRTETLRLRASGNSFSYAFNVVAPALDAYRYQLLALSFDVSLYPVRISVDPEVLDEVRAHVRVTPDPTDSVHRREILVAESEAEFLDCLKAIFGTQTVRQAIATLMSQADPLWQSEASPP